MLGYKTPGNEPDPQVVFLQRLRANDAAAFEDLVRSESGRMLAVARGILRNEEDARDAVQAAFLAAFRNLDRFDGNCRVGTWLHRIVVNASLMQLRRGRRRPECSINELLPQFDETDHQVVPSIPWSRPDVALLQDENRALVRRCIDELPDRYRVVLLLRDIEEMDTASAAAALGCSENAVKVRLHRARQALRTLLDRQLRKA